MKKTFFILWASFTALILIILRPVPLTIHAIVISLILGLIIAFVSWFIIMSIKKELY